MKRRSFFGTVAALLVGGWRFPRTSQAPVIVDEASLRYGNSADVEVDWGVQHMGGNLEAMGGLNGWTTKPEN